MTKKKFVGVDVSKDYLDIYISGGEKFRKRNQLSSIKRLTEKLSKLAVELVVVEATGGYEQLFVESLHEASIPVSVVNPRRTNNFTKSLGKQAKTDLLDAEALCLYAERMQPKLTEPVSAEQKELRSLVLRREQLVGAIVAEKNRLKAPGATDTVRDSVQEVLTFLNQQIKALDKQIKNNIDNNDAFSRKDKILQKARGVGRTTSATLIALVPEIGEINRKQIAALVGVAPFNHDSGRKFGKRSIYGGRSQVRSVLYMATITAIRSNPCIRNFYLRLVQSGKAAKIAITACMRKLLTALNAMVRDNADWSDSKYLTQKA